MDRARNLHCLRGSRAVLHSHREVEGACSRRGTGNHSVSLTQSHSIGKGSGLDGKRVRLLAACNHPNGSSTRIGFVLYPVGKRFSLNFQRLVDVERQIGRVDEVVLVGRRDREGVRVRCSRRAGNFARFRIKRQTIRQAIALHKCPRVGSYATGGLERR